MYFFRSFSLLLLVPTNMFTVCIAWAVVVFFFSSRRRHTRSLCDWSSDVCSSDLLVLLRGRAVGILVPERREVVRPGTHPDNVVALGDRKSVV